MPQHEVEISITKAGEVKVYIKGVKGKSCLAYSKWLSQVVGKVKNQQLTSEYYELPSKATFEIEQNLTTDE